MSQWIENLSLDLGNEHDNKQLPRHDKDRKKRGAEVM